MKSLTKNISKQLILLTLLLGGITYSAQAQRNPGPAQFFFNQYQANAAMAGIDSSLNLNLSYNKQYDDMPGSSVNKLLTADYNLGKRVGLGLNLSNQKAGLLTKTRVALSYAYHLPVGGDGQTLHFGLSAAVENNSLPINEVDGDQNDPSLQEYNSRGAYMDGDFGIAYTGSGLTLQAAMPTIRNYIVKETYSTIDRSVLYSAASYKINMGEELSSIEPKLSYTMVKGNTDIWDAGVNVKVASNLADIQAIYHSTKSYTVGLGVNMLSRIQLLALYTSETKALRTYTDGNLSLNMKISLFTKSR
ncbi:PorP/SprF family type IX secretion system membrane protein [Solitalea canadensis]|uniref:Bacteroidetes-specific putative membrane protein n=1 Tax=Solitalea canadensis (strain ATCC 29591 / DSM 3403 / JCM 21819 / LMG 8368 / NBRC 15130 / NCIMB 12057 / USAM 9D) TaxID=929556 RepID=H8KUZ7_SOLCM|nr:PorP/SprF family type IX secretion system membrane protein [Solitalea canadensis]AFD07697.1 Bacteroidetes-specific putative membrane protein [Solitalea canadensis DSM 3403]